MAGAQAPIVALPRSPLVPVRVGDIYQRFSSVEEGVVENIIKFSIPRVLQPGSGLPFAERQPKFCANSWANITCISFKLSEPEVAKVTSSTCLQMTGSVCWCVSSPLLCTVLRSAPCALVTCSAKVGSYIC